jgi:hypothetical protein
MIVMAILMVQILIVPSLPALIMVLTETDVKPILVAVGAEKIKNVFNLWSPLLNHNVMQLAAVGTKRKEPAGKDKRLFSKNSSLDLSIIFENMIKAGPAMALPYCSHFPQTIMQHK